MNGDRIEVDAGEWARLRGIEERAEHLAEGRMPPYRSGAGAAAAAAWTSAGEWVLGRSARRGGVPSAPVTSPADETKSRP